MRLREYIPQRTDDGTIRTVPIGNSLAPWRTWLNEDEIGYAKNVDRLLTRIEIFNHKLRAELGAKAARGLVLSWRRF
jgi:hypothetical protein